MTKQQQKTLIKNLFPTCEIRDFLCNDLFEEFKTFLPYKIVLGAQNKNADMRQHNYNEALQKIKEFVLTNKNYNQVIFEKLPIRDFNFLIEYLLIGYVFSLSLTEATPTDAFTNKCSILYGKMLDFLYI